MTQVVVNNITSGYNLSKFNNNFINLSTWANNVALSNTGGNNVMHQDFDLNSNDLLNVNQLHTSTLILDGTPVVPGNLGSFAPNSVGTPQLVDGAVTDSKIASVSGNKATFLQLGAGAVLTDLQTNAREQISVKQFGAVGDGITDDSAAILATIAAALARNKEVFVPRGTYIASLGSLNTSVRMRGEGLGKSIIKRPLLATGPVVFCSSLTSSYHFEDIGFDANSANVNQGHVVFVATGVQSFVAERCKMTGGVGFGVGICIGDNNANKGTYTLRRVRNCVITGNNGGGMQITQENNIQIDGNEIFSNGTPGNGNGITVSYFIFPPVPFATQVLKVTNNQIYNNGSAGCFILGSIIGGTAAQPLFGVQPNPNANVIVSDNHVYTNYGYGMIVQADGANVVNNQCFGNGNITSPQASAYAGLLVNAINVSVVGNVCYNNSGFGVDMGGSSNFAFTGNVVKNNCNNGGNSGFIGLNLGSCQYGTISGNHIALNGPTSGGVQIMVPGYDGGTNAFPPLTKSLTIVGNQIQCGVGSTQVGIRLYGNPTLCSVKNNNITGGTLNTAIQIQTSASVDMSGNISDQISMYGYQTTAAAGLVFPDYVESIFLTGTATTTNLLTISNQNFFQKVSEAIVTNVGSGYDPANPPAVTITGGGGTGATAFAGIDGAGRLVSVNIVNNGSGYTSTPTITIAPPVSGVTATATAVVGVNNIAGRKLTIFCAGAVTFNTANNIVVPGGTVSIAANGVIDFLGNTDGKFYMRSKSA